MKEIVERLQETRQIELAKSILESKGYNVTKRDSLSKGSMRESAQPSALKKLLDLDGGVNNYDDHPEMFDKYGNAALAEITKFLGCNKEDLVELLDRDEGLDIEGYQELCDYVYENSKGQGAIKLETNGHGPYDSLTPSYMTDGSGAKYVFHSDSDGFPGFIVSLKVR